MNELIWELHGDHHAGEPSARGLGIRGVAWPGFSRDAVPGCDLLQTGNS